jgi:protein-S-isoprenylcysteine O-methyltransferase Ste14
MGHHAALLGLFGGWLAYAALHSLLAAHAVKACISRRWPAAMRYYRLAYNVIATLFLLPLLWATYALPGEPLWRWSGSGAWLANALAVAALAGIWRASRAYDMAEFLGLQAWRAQVGEDGALRLSALHRYVRHPWYSLGLLLIWTRDMNAPFLVSALAVTLYLIVGARLEEKKLLARFGDVYRDYMQRVPGLIPLPGKRLSAAEAEALMRRSMERPGHRQDEL